MGSGALETNEEAENSLHKQASQVSDANDAVADPDVPAKRARLQKEQKDLTFQDIYQNDGMFDDYDDEDSDWEPFQLHNKCVEFEIKKWFCRNCTMVNLDHDDCCYICGEHKDSKILSLGFFASPLAQDEDLTEVQGIVKGLKDVGSQESVANSSTAIGFDERMLLHAEVEKKSTLHPERPDRLQAIAASLARAGIFPGKCYSIPAREITPEELITVWGTAIMQNRYRETDYLLALVVTLGCSVFILYPAGTDISPYGRGRENTVWGVLLMLGYLGCDGFTSTFQDKMFKGYNMEIHNQIFYTTLSSCILSLTGLIIQGHLLPAVEFVYIHKDCFFDIALLSTVATASQFFISYTIRTFGALTFATIMTTRQLVSILLSCVWFAHPLSWQQWIGAVIVFGAIYAKSFLRKAPEKTTSVEHVQNGNGNSNNLENP